MTDPGKISHDLTDPYAVTSWGVTNKPFEKVTPSGQRCLVRKLEMEDILVHGLMNELDGISTALMSEEGSDPKDDSSLMNAFQDQKKFKQLNATIGKIIEITVLKPTIYSVPEGDEQRVKGRAYIDQVDFMDKMALFQAVFEGFKGLETFREESTAGLGTVENVQALPETAQSPTWDTL
jgi:hypothetical protein